MDSSTTVQTLFPQIQDLQLTIVTDSIDIMMACSSLPNIRLYALGGLYTPNARCFSSSQGRNLLENLYFDIAFISCRTISLSEGLCDSNVDEAATKCLAAQHASKTIAMVDHTKFDNVSFAKICDLEEIDVLISDKELDDQWMQVLQKKSGRRINFPPVLSRSITFLVLKALTRLNQSKMRYCNFTCNTAFYVHLVYGTLFPFILLHI